jgi:hypothetical protein
MTDTPFQVTEPLSTQALAWLRQSALADGSTYSRVLLHLLERVEALEAADHFVEVPKMAPTPEAVTVAEDAELFSVAELERFPIHAYRACYNLGRQHGAAQPAHAAAPAGGLVEVGELVEWIHREAIHGPDADEWRRAATLLQQQAAPAPVVVPVAIPGEQWHEDDGACLWWRFPIVEPPWAGDPRGDDWPGYHTHFTRIVCPLPQVGEGEG